MVSILLVLLKIVTLAAAGVFGACVLAGMGYCTLLLIRLIRGADSSSPFAVLAYYRAIKTARELPSSVASIESGMYRVRRIAIRASGSSSDRWYFNGHRRATFGAELIMLPSKPSNHAMQSTPKHSRAG